MDRTHYALDHCEGWILHYAVTDGRTFAYNDTPLTALGVLSAVDWLTASGLAVSYSVTEACACG